MEYLRVDKENTNEILLHYQDHGSGDPVVLIHGYPFAGVAWEKQEAALLEAGHRVVTYDRRGFGLSSQPSRGYDYDTFASDLDQLLRHLDLRGVTLVGHSMGTGEIARYLGRYGSERIARAVFVSPIPPFLLQTDDNPEGVDRGVFEKIQSAILADRYAYLTEFLKNFYNLGKLLQKSDVSEEKLRADFHLAARASPIATLACVQTWLEDFRADVAAIDVPSLVIHGDADQILPFDVTAARLAEQLRCRLVRVEGGSHGIPWTHGDLVSREILLFIQASGGMRPGLQIAGRAVGVTGAAEAFQPGRSGTA